jgi:hypothetical protein
MMRYSGPRSWTRGYAIDGIKHVLEGRRARRAVENAKTETENPAREKRTLS